MNVNSYRLVSIILFLPFVLMFSGCSVIHTGHRFDQNKVFLLESGKTTPEGVVALFGAPDNILRKPSEGATAYIYKNITSSFVGIPIPPIATLGKAKNTGYQLTVFFTEDADRNQTVASYELLEFNERIYSDD